MMITTCMSCLTIGGPNKEHGAVNTMVLTPKINWENLGGAKKREETPAHNMSYKTNPKYLGGVKRR